MESRQTVTTFYKLHFHLTTMKAFLLIILGLVYAASGQTVECPGPYHAVGNGCYTFPDTLVNWVDANTICQFSGGYLAKIDSAAEQSALFSYNTHFNLTYYRWLGASDSLSDGIWRWVPSGATVDYSNWNSGQPVTGDSSNCAAWNPIYDFWKTFPCCDVTAFALCEALPL